MSGIFLRSWTTVLENVFLAVSFFVVFLAVSFFGGISGGIFAVFLVFLQYRYGTGTTVSHVSNTEYRYCIKIGYTAMHCRPYEFSQMVVSSVVSLAYNTIKIYE